VTPWLAVIGIGEDGVAALSGSARAFINDAEILVGGERHHGLAPGFRAERIVWDQPLSRTLDAIAEHAGRRVVVLASGDPMWFGIGVALTRRFGREAMVVLPQRSAFTLAAARMQWPLGACATLTLHGRPLAALRLHLAPEAQLLVLSEDGATPARVAALLDQSGWGASELTVLEHLDGAREKRIDGSASAWRETRCADLNILAIRCHAVQGARVLPRTPGLPDDAFEHDGQLTKREIRAATLAALAPLPGARLWDIGAGSGSIAIEWLRAAAGAHAFAIEQSPERCLVIARNAAALGVPELEIREGTAPATLEGLPRPDAVFVGGGIAIPHLIETAWDALAPGGRLVANAVTLDGEAALLTGQTRHGGEIVRIAVARAEPTSGHLLWRALAPVTQWRGVKP
jgi:precorrin-6Y C5,15-methyltransferase (decarboxylating)